MVQLMFEHGDSDGRFNRKQLDQDSPGWAGTLPVDFVMAVSERMRRTGRFALEKAQRNSGSLAPQTPYQKGDKVPVDGQIVEVIDAGALPLTRDQIEAEIEKSAKKMARKMLTDVLSENAFCPKCGRSLARLFSGIGGGE